MDEPGPEFSDEVLRLLTGRNFCHVGTIRRDGRPRIVPVWVDADEGCVILNSVAGRAWVSDLERDPRITCTITNRENPYEHVQIIGDVIDKSTGGADDHIDKLANRYLGEETYRFRKPQDRRLLIRVSAKQVIHRFSSIGLNKSQDSPPTN